MISKKMSKFTTISASKRLMASMEVAINNMIEEVGLKVGDVVGFKENRDYRIKIDGKEYYRTRIEDLLYKEV